MIVWALLAPAWSAEPCAAHRDGLLVPAAPIVFETSTATLKEPEVAVTSIVCALQQQPALTVQVEVHTDSRGADVYNLRKSQERAEAVRTALIAAGVDAGRVTAVGYGELYPIAPNTTTEGRAQNSRIELHTDPPETRPPRPEPPEPVEPAPPPAPVVDAWCTALGDAVQSGKPTSWTRSGTVSAVADRMARCLDTSWKTSRDGDALYATKAGWTLAVEPADTAVRVDLTHH